MLILDEPAAALDPIGRRDVLDVMRALRERTTIFYSTHILDDVERVSDTVAILSGGRLVAQAPVDRLLQGSGVIYSLDLREPCPGLEGLLRQQTWITSVDVEHRPEATTVHVGVADETVAEHHLLRLVLDVPGAVVLSFDRSRQSLEDLFIGLVEEGAQP